jgi:hypothetical protein
MNIGFDVISPASDDRDRVTFFAVGRRRLTRTAARVGLSV